MEFLFELIDDSVFLKDGRDGTFLDLFEFLEELLMGVFELLMVVFELMDFEFFFLFRLEEFKHLVLLGDEFLVELVHNFFELLFLVLVPDGVFVLFLKLVGFGSFVLEFGFGLGIG